MEKAAKLRLKQFMEANFCFYGLKDVGFWPSGIRKTDYERQAERICKFFGFKTIYEYKPVCRGLLCKGNCSFTSPKCKSYNVTKWLPLKVDSIEMISKDSWLN